jgi:AAA+ ATPase superfamily predicted ATPase
MKSLNNPFVEYGYKGPEYFCDREQEVAQLISALHNESNVALISPRRIGKSGLIHHAFHLIREQSPDIACIYIDILNTRNQKDFIDVFASKVIASLGGNLQSALQKAASFFKGLRPTITFDEFSGAPTFSFHIEPSKESNTIEQIFQYIRQSGKRCYIAFDEFQQITNYPETGLEALLRSQIQFTDNAYFVFAGSEQHLMSEIFLSAQRPFYLASQIMNIDVIEEKKYRDFANAMFRRQNREISEETFHQIYAVVDGQTWYVQTILHQLYIMTEESLNTETVNKAIDIILNKFSTSFSNYYLSITNNQAMLLRAIGKEGCVKEPLGQTFMSQHHLPALSSTRQALNALEKKQFIYKTNAGYIVYDRFLGLWLRNRI